MLVLSRRIGESILIDEVLRATVAVIGDDFVDLGLAELDGTQLGGITLKTHQRCPVVPGVSGVMIKKMEEGRVQLGFAYSPGTSITRDEVTNSS